ncbi:MAG: hypothetical protein QOF76_2942 [Solirubrobacteraceae bacterium]|nr:hypothetical protein [Solirubrobacteraceae bacterium]
MTSRADVQRLLEDGHSFETAGRELGLPPGRVFMIAEGHPADTSSGAQPRQDLVNPPPFNPTVKQHVLDWVAERAARELG